MIRLIWLGCLAYLTVGLGQLVVGAVMEPMVGAYGVQYGDGGQLVMNQFLGGLAGTLFAPWLMRTLGRRALLLGAMTVMAAAEIVYTLAPPWGAMLVLGPVAGFGFGITETVVGSFIIGSAGERGNVAMSRVEVSFGVGALLMPFVGALLIDIDRWRLAFGVVGVLAVITVVLWASLWPTILNAAPVGATQVGADGNKRHASVRLPLLGTGPARWVLIACAVFFFLYVGFEMSYAHYLPTLLVQEGSITEATAALALGVYWGAMTIGRLYAGHLADRIGSTSYLLSMCGIAALAFILMGFFGSAAPMFVLAAVAGLAMSGMFAIALVFANRYAPGMTERTTSLLIACGLFGGAVLPKLAGWSLDALGGDVTRWLLAGFALLLLAVAAAASAASRKAARAAARLAA
ncbi:MFS transporter, FHS family, glucose/mannose:H+ symporter [Cohnella sp. OV330]|uniref:MFS transporter n=1 Tax=Cohnella sp. OV330 TaxID=1855288 RepID=UPI0008E7AFC4|nr:MFS transporter [Cohnella sp. OV330]SFB59899.1 MFS transporter, FHS family, glucose/mannose:H+ symporter [Cohnella sp. OV330]